MNVAAADLKIQGLVQGVGYRYFCYKLAVNSGLKGWVSNRPDGSVVARLEGDKGAVLALIEQLKTGPHHGQVTAVDIDWVEPSDESGEFSIVY
ncbi:MAG: acylphosphatase [candidate division Zixibacteria bacterium]